MTAAATLPRVDAGAPPFVLLDDARVRGGAAARLFVDPVETLVAAASADIPDLLSALESAAGRGLHAAGYLAYEGGQGLAPAWRGATTAVAAADTALLLVRPVDRVERIDRRSRCGAAARR